VRPPSLPLRGAARALAVASLTTVLAAAAAAPAAAQVVYRRLDFTFRADFAGPFVVNLVDGSTFGTALPGVFPTCPGPGCGWDLGLRFGNAPNWQVVLPSTFGVVTPVAAAERGVVAAGAAGPVQALALGALVGPASSYNTDPSGVGADALLDLGEQFIGLRFRNEVGGTVHHGWARILLTRPLASGTVVDYAFEATPGRAIAVGAGLPVEVIPEPGTVVLVAGGLAVVGAGTAVRARPRGARR
jgi:hypothetical protein